MHFDSATENTLSWMPGHWNDKADLELSFFPAHHQITQVSDHKLQNYMLQLKSQTQSQLVSRKYSYISSPDSILKLS